MELIKIEGMCAESVLFILSQSRISNDCEQSFDEKKTNNIHLQLRIIDSAMTV